MVLILRADAILTPAGELKPGELEIDEGGRIAYVGAPRAASQVTHDLSGHALMPGLVNGHTHSAMALQRGISDDQGLAPWLTAVQGVEQRLTRDDVVAGLELAMLEMIETGTTSFADMYHWDAGLLDLVRDSGMRVRAAPAVFTAESVGFPGVSPMTGAEVLDQTEALASRFAGDPQIALAYGPHAPYTCPPDLLRHIAERSERTGIPIHIHLSESIAEVEQSAETYGATPVAHLDSLEFFDVEVLAAHCVHLTADEILVLARKGAAVSHNPVSNLKLGCGIAPLPEMRAAGVRIALGTDSAASNNSLDLFEELKLAAILHRGARRDASAVSAREVLEMATGGGAEAIGLPNTGALEVGRLADVIAIDLSGASATPLDSLASHLVFSTTGADVRHVFIGGRHVYANGEHLTLDAERILGAARAAALRLRETAR